MNEPNANTEVEKLDLSSLDVAELKRQELVELFPEVRTEDGKIDFERLKAVLGEMVDSGRERYGMNWPGKAECMRTIQAPSMGTLLPMPEESVDWDTTENVIIEGDNLEVLKLLQKSYLGKIKMIYIDPPYNTGNDFIYPDNYAESLQTYLEYTGQADSSGRKFGTNTDSDGRFHSRWLNMMHPRLYLARQLLRNDGVIFVSIDDHEVDNLRKLLSEVFGEENFVAEIVWQRTFASKNDAKHFSTEHEYVIMFAKNLDSLAVNLLERGETQNARYQNPDNDPRGPWTSTDLLRMEHRDNSVYTIVAPNGKKWTPVQGTSWRHPEEEMLQLIANGDVTFGSDGNAKPRRKRFLKDVKQGIVPQTIWKHTEVSHTQEAKQSLNKLFDGVPVFDTPKPSKLIERMLTLATSNESPDLVLDFFAGSGVLAEAVIRLNEKDGGCRRYIMVQLPEATENTSFKTISAISIERARRVGRSFAEAKDKQLNLDGNRLKSDLGFRVFSLGSSNFIPWDGTASNDAEQLAKQLKLGIDHTRSDRTPQDLLFEVLLKSWGEPALSLKVGEETIVGVRVFSIAEGAFLICLEEKVTLEFIRALAARKPDRVVMRESAFAGNDQLKTNAVQTFKSQGVTSFKVV